MKACSRVGCALPACWRVTFAAANADGSHDEARVCNRHLLDYEGQIGRREVRFDDLDAAFTSQQAEWLVTFYRNLPGQNLQRSSPEVPDLLQSESQEAYERYPYFDMRHMNVRE
jgi:hypothetical protein